MNVFYHFRYYVGIIAFAVFSSSLYAVPPNELTAPLTLSLADRTRATVFIQGNNVVVKLQNGNTHVLVNNINNVPEYAQDIWIQDFNFDGFQDIAVTTEVNTRSNDQSYTIFTWENRLKQFIPLHYPGGLSNLEIEPHHKQVISSYQTGDLWTENTYRYTNKQPYLYSKSVLIASNIWHTTVYNPQHQVIRSLVSNNGKVNRPPNPVLLTVRSDHVPLYAQPLPSTRLPIDLKRGNVLTIVDFKRGPRHFHWVNVRANVNNLVLQGWTLLSNLTRSN